MGLTLAAVLGVETSGLDLRTTAGDVLDRLATGPFESGKCGPPPSADAVSWLVVRALPVQEADSVTPIERVLTSLAGSSSEIRVRIHHHAARGLGVYVGATDRRLVSRLRVMLAPACDIGPAAQVPDLVPPILTGVAYRLQADLTADSTQNATRANLLEVLTSVPGGWSVELTLQSVGQPELQAARHQINRLADYAAERITTTQQRTSTQSATTVSAGWSRVQAWASVLQGHVTNAGALGGWRLSTWATATDVATVNQVLAGLHGAVHEHDRRQFFAHDLDLAQQAVSPHSLLSTREVADLVASPAFASPGLAVRKAPPGHRRPASSRERIVLGSYWSTDLPASIGLDDLEGHAFVTGTTGAGKTTTLHRLLADVWNQHRVPFLVIDPVKDEYSDVARYFRGGINVVTGQALSLNVLRAWPGEDPRMHVAQVAQAFRGAFTMPSPTPYVVTQLFDSIAMQPGGPDGTDLYDVRDLLDPLVTSLGYAPEAQSNIRAALGTRLNLLLAPSRAHRFVWGDSAMVDQLFDRPSVITLADLVDEEERSFLVLLVALAAWARARSRTVARPVEHLLVVEEAHRVIPEVGPVANDQESGSAQRVSATLLAAMLAEVRSFGEQVIVVDQSPSKVASDVVRNTNLKISHRIVHPEDQAQIAGAIGLSQADAELLGGLARGQVVLSTRREPAPQTIQIKPLDKPQPSAVVRPVRRTSSAWPCCSDRPEDHYRAWQAAASVEGAMALFLAACRVGTGNGVRQVVHEQLARSAQPLAARSDCLAWAGLRRLLVRERRQALLANAEAVQRSLQALFELWVARVAPSLISATDFQVPGIGLKRTCVECGAICTVRVPALAILADGPRTGLATLGAPRWRDELSEIGTWLLAERSRLTTLLGSDGAITVLRCQVHQAVRRHGLGRDIAQGLVTRAGLA